MNFFEEEKNINFVYIYKWASYASILVTIMSIICILLKGINLSVEFTGGYQIQVNHKNRINEEHIRNLLRKNSIIDFQVTTYDSYNYSIIKIPIQKERKLVKNSINGNTRERQELKSKIEKVLEDNISIKNVDYIGPQIRAEIIKKSILALLSSLICIFFYIGARFERKFAISAIIALVHDPIIILGIFSLFNLKFTPTVFASILAVIGYSLNDTVVIFDRIRENMTKKSTKSIKEIINDSINETMSRTIITSGLTLLVLSILFLFGGSSLYEFSLSLILGVIVGTYSSIYIAGSLLVSLGIKKTNIVCEHR